MSDYQFFTLTGPPYAREGNVIACEYPDICDRYVEHVFPDEETAIRVMEQVIKQWSEGGFVEFNKAVKEAFKS